MILLMIASLNGVENTFRLHFKGKAPSKLRSM